VKWFPDRRGLITGIAVGGFGAGALITAPLATRLIQSVGVLSTFAYLGIHRRQRLAFCHEDLMSVAPSRLLELKRAFCLEREMKSSRTVIMIVYLASSNLLKLWRYLSIRRETAPPKLEVSFKVMRVLWSGRDTKETTPAAR
jgi:hypothetical protein